MIGDRRPIGYWLKHLDGLINDGFDQTLDGAGLTRRQWQTLSTLARDAASHRELLDALAPFLGRNDTELSGSIDALTARGWVSLSEAGRHELTDSGSSHHQEIQAEVDGFRRALLTGVTIDEYRATIDVLQRMSATLEAMPARADAPSPTIPADDGPVTDRLDGAQR